MHMHMHMHMHMRMHMHMHMHIACTCTTCAPAPHSHSHPRPNQLPTLAIEPIYPPLPHQTPTPTPYTGARCPSSCAGARPPPTFTAAGYARRSPARQRRICPPRCDASRRRRRRRATPPSRRRPAMNRALHRTHRKCAKSAEERLETSTGLLGEIISILACYSAFPESKTRKVPTSTLRCVLVSS